MRLLGNGGFLSSTLTCVAAWHDRPTKGSASFLAWVSLGHFLAPPMASHLRELSRAWTSGCKSKSAGTVQMERPTQRRVCRGSPVGSWRASGALLPGSSARACLQTCSCHDAVSVHLPQGDLLQECAQPRCQSSAARPGDLFSLSRQPSSAGYVLIICAICEEYCRVAFVLTGKRQL